LYGGTAPVHAGNSYHNYDEAFDIIINRESEGITRAQDIAAIAYLKDIVRTMDLFVEVIGPGDGDPNHEAHLHVGGLKRVPTKEELEILRNPLP
jgi:hypothetical protein